ncbi:RND transporter [Pseudoalteromonas rubra]|uniref:RND transporter n=1 Tax=Pseudoalteromonas rubra TaxID=43658 RepID=A0A5S3WNA4_9GAMM|nr:HlyD family efflux transporter periplasmic adaptor subunit [Pseudoalteromonas rubra]TMP29410.1 RND transporter [Pseudoalteromonas rubra]TMP33988.1 RND transporter [Pseudoalteromonas rubra]
MDIVRTKKSPLLRHKGKATSALGLVVMTCLAVFFNRHTSATNLVDKAPLLIDTVRRGELKVTVRGSGVLVPAQIRWITTPVDGRVEQVFKKAGAQVKQGDVLLQLSNPELKESLDQARWQLQALEAQTHAEQVTLESALLDQEIAVVDEKLNLERAELTLAAQEKLLAQGIVAVSKIDFEEVKINVAQFRQRFLLEQQRLDKRRENLAAQLRAGNARLNSLRKQVERIEQQVNGLTVIATMDSIVQAMPLEPGQQIRAGSNLAMLARNDQFVAQLRIPESQIKDVQIGQAVVLDTRASQINGSVKRIDPAVSDSAVLVEVALSGELPKEVRPALSVDGVIEIATLADTLFVKRPVMASGFSQASLYLLDQSGEQASRQPLTFGHMSSQYIEIEHGATVGTRIILSDTSHWQHSNVRFSQPFSAQY